LPLRAELGGLRHASNPLKRSADLTPHRATMCERQCQ
jgi:hypothetical protein